MQGWLDAKKTDSGPTGKGTISNVVPDAVIGCSSGFQMLGPDVAMRRLTGRSVLKPATRAGLACHQLSLVQGAQQRLWSFAAL